MFKEILLTYLGVEYPTKRRTFGLLNSRWIGSIKKCIYFAKFFRSCIVFVKWYLNTSELLENRNYLCRVKNKDSWYNFTTFRRYLNKVWNGILDTENPLQGTNQNQSGSHNQRRIKKTCKQLNIWSTWIVFRKSFGLSGSSKGYDPTSITYKVTPHDHTSATWYQIYGNIKEIN